MINYMMVMFLIIGVIKLMYTGLFMICLYEVNKDLDLF